MLALISVSDKRNLVPFAQALHELGWRLLSTGGTLACLSDAHVPAIKVASYTGSPEILGGRVKTLHPKIHGGLLGRPDLPSDAREMADQGIEPIGLLVVNLYPFRETVARDVPRADAIEQIDVGGPAMIRAAAKNSEHVAVVTDPEDYVAIVDELRATGSVSAPTRRRLQLKAFQHTAAYDAAIAAYLGREQGDPFPVELAVEARRTQLLRYGENPHQRAAVYTVGPPPAGPSVARAVQRQGKELSYNNLLDLDSALALLLEFPEAPAAVVVKHNTPCGVATAKDLMSAYRTAREVDETSAFGGIVALNRHVDLATARVLVETFLEAVIAPSYAPEALATLSAKKGLRVMEVGDALADPALRPTPQIDLRSISGGLLATDRDAVEPPAEWRCVTTRAPTDAELRAARFAWRVVKHVKSNAIVFADESRLLAQAGGQTSRVDAVRIAAARGGEALVGSAVASDAFFPFRDGIDWIAAAKATCVVHPGGSVRDPEIISVANEHGLAMLTTGVRHFRH